jgi:Uma2 family endonuclease
MSSVSTNPLIPSGPPATIDDLYRVEGKAELIGGRIVRFMPSGLRPSKVAFRIAMSLEAHAVATNSGQAYPDGLGYAIRPPLKSGRQSFSPDASFCAGAVPETMRFGEGPPTFAVEVRSENDYTAAAQREMAAKRADYFEAGTLVVWDVDPIARTIASYRSDSPLQPTVFKTGEIANAEPAVPGWTVNVDDLITASS